MSTPPGRDAERSDGPVKLRHNPGFRNLWLAATVSDLGTEISTIAVPLVAVITLRASNLKVGLLATAQTLPFLLLSLPVGVWGDRISKNVLLISADLARAGLLFSVPVSYWWGGLTIWQLYGVVFAVAASTVCFDIARVSMLPELVRREQFPTANSALDASEQSAAVLGPGVGGILVGRAGGPSAVLADAVSYLWSAAFLARVRSDQTETADRVAGANPVGGMRREIREGLSYVLHQRFLRPLALAGPLLVLASRTARVVLILYLVRGVGLSAALVGVVFSIGSIGFLAGALLAPLVSRRLGPGRALIASGGFIGPALLVMAIPPPGIAAPFVVLGLVGYGLAALTFNITNVSLRQAITPDHLMGRANATARFLSSLAAPAAGLTGGALASQVGYRPTLVLTRFLAVMGFILLLASPLRTLHGAPGAA